MNTLFEQARNDIAELFLQAERGVLDPVRARIAIHAIHFTLLRAADEADKQRSYTVKAWRQAQESYGG